MKKFFSAVTLAFICITALASIEAGLVTGQLIWCTYLLAAVSIIISTYLLAM